MFLWNDEGMYTRKNPTSMWHFIRGNDIYGVAGATFIFGNGRHGRPTKPAKILKVDGEKASKVMI